MIVRRATLADLPRIGRLGALLIEEHHEFDAQRFLAARDRTPADYASFIRTQLEDPDVAVLLADDDGVVIGYTYAALGEGGTQKAESGGEDQGVRSSAVTEGSTVRDPERERHNFGLANPSLAWNNT